MPTRGRGREWIKVQQFSGWSLSPVIGRIVALIVFVAFTMHLGTVSQLYMVFEGAFGRVLGVAIVRDASVRGSTPIHSPEILGITHVCPTLTGQT